MTGRSPEGRGHRGVPHTADARIEAWGPTRETCIAEAVAGLVESFADTEGARPGWTVSSELSPDSDPDALVAVLDEVIYVLDAQGGVPLHIELTPAPAGLGLVLHLAALDDVEFVGAVPKAVTLHDLRFDRSAAGWSCAVTIDV
jgi:SHS2 domain-containing protein